MKGQDGGEGRTRPQLAIIKRPTSHSGVPRSTARLTALVTGWLTYGGGGGGGGLGSSGDRRMSSNDDGAIFSIFFSNIFFFYDVFPSADGNVFPLFFYRVFPITFLCDTSASFYMPFPEARRVVSLVIFLSHFYFFRLPVFPW